MPINGTCLLNDRPLSTLMCPGVGNFSAFSGMPADRNNPAAVANADSGPLPQGRYFIVDRQSGGHLGWLYDFARTHFYGTDRSQWFALYRADGTLDDETFVNGVRHGAFRLHPTGPRGVARAASRSSILPRFSDLLAICGAIKHRASFPALR